MSSSEKLVLASISARGVVQGVGFRPFIYKLAKKYKLNGWVLNTSEDVKIEVEGEKSTVDKFFRDLKKEAPPLAKIDNLTIKFNKPAGYRDFQIRQSTPEQDKYQLVSPDIATCQHCIEEIFNPADRRYRYPFTNCTNCGPRFTIIEDIPYDRPRTTMRAFSMCPSCQSEYNNPLNRRFHAQPNACSVCGPILGLLDYRGKSVNAPDPISFTGELLKEGKIVAIKGLGGFLLACDATSRQAVDLLRIRKRRPSKPFAVMVMDLAEAKKHCRIIPEEEQLLRSPQSPIVLVPWKKASSICRSVAPQNKYLGIMLPYTPLHHLLLNQMQTPLVMTSGNISEEPIAGDNEEAVCRLSGIADYFLVNNRDIFARYDDSVTFIENKQIQIIRRARGFAPFPIRLGFKSKQTLASGADEKNTFCLTRDKYAFLSQHIGDMDNLETLEHMENTLAIYQRLFRIKPEVIAYDMHPEYRSSKFAQNMSKDGDIKSVAIQHHHAHIVSCMVDNNINDPVIGVSLDGTGYGSDGKIWGGEFMIADYKTFVRLGHLEYLPLPGGEVAIRRPYRIAIGYLCKLLGEDILESNPPLLKNVSQEEIELIKQQVKSGINSPLNSSMGRLFDSISALLGIRGIIDYEAQAAVELEMCAHEDTKAGDESYNFDIIERDGIYLIKLKTLFLNLLTDLSNQIPNSFICMKFHNTVTKMIVEQCRLIRDKTNIKGVALSGGVFQNRLLLKKTIPALNTAGFIVYNHKQVPCNDGGISLGQAVIANYQE